MNKRYVSLFLMMCMLLTGFGRTTAYASNEESLEMQYLMEVLGGYLTVNDDLEYTDLFISEQRHIYTFDGSESDKNYYLLISNNSVIAMIVVEKVEEYFYSYLTTENIEIISSLYVECEPFALATINGNLIVATEQEYEILVSDYSGTGIQNLDLNDIFDKATSVIALDISHIPMVASAGNTYTATGNPPPYVANDEYNNKGLCWAACVASVVNYRRGNVAETAYSIFMDCWETVDCSEDNIPDGADKWVKIAFEENGISNITYEANSLPVDYIEVLLGTYSKPIIITVYRYDELGRVEGGHAVVVYEFYNGGGYGYFKVMDPNYDRSYITITVPYETLQDTSSFPYVPTWDTSIKYTAWTGSFY